MNMHILIKHAYHTIRTHAVQSLLTTLGISIGIAVVIVTVSISNGIEQTTHTELTALSEGGLVIVPDNITQRGAISLNDIATNNTTLTEADFQALQQLLSQDILAISRGYITNTTIEQGRNIIIQQIIGADPAIFNIKNLTLQKGAFFTQQHIEQYEPVVVLGYSLNHKLFGNAHSIGATIRIFNKLFTVIGIMNPIAHLAGLSDPNNDAFIPSTTAQIYAQKAGVRKGNLNFIALQVNQKQNNNKTITRKIKQILQTLHKKTPDIPDDFTILDHTALAKSTNKTSNMIRIFGFIAGLLALFVGGIGVMNIMLLSVRERTREIGIKLALGATQQMIQLQFLIEAIMLCLFGALFGVILGIIIQLVLSHTMHVPTKLEIYPIIIALWTTTLIGLFFGYQPAHQASLMNPADALLGKRR
ncbi:MAG TPA: ABC transporter permease [Candidatus Babeliales bacterium]|nr:ABC transporter permease [Candidatus Babeliales bacterium]